MNEKNIAKKIQEREISNVEAMRHLEKEGIVNERRGRWDNGREFERAVMGKRTISKQINFLEYKKKEAEILGPYAKSGRIIPDHKKELIIKLFKHYYLGDPEDPETEYMNEVRLSLADKLHLETEEEMKRLRFYNSVDTSLDVKCGYDGFVEYEEDGRVYRVPLDPTLDPEGDRKKYTDPSLVIVAPENFPEPDEDDFEEKTDWLGEVIAVQLLKEKERQRKVEREKYKKRGINESLVTADRKRRTQIREYRP